MGAVVAGIVDVAARAGVSVATVSRALRGLPNVAAPTRRRVLDAAEALDYVVHPHASRLAAGRTRTIGMVVPLFTQWYFTQVVHGAESVLAAQGYDVLLYNVGGPESRERFFATLPFRRRVDGIILIDLALTPAEEEALGGLAEPVTLVGSSRGRFPTVSIDNRAATTAATRHLADLGHVRIATITGSPDDQLHFTAPPERLEAHRAVLAERGLPSGPELEEPGCFTLQGGAAAMARLLPAAPTGVVAASDEMAIGALRTLREAGLEVPGDVSVIGFDDHELAAFVDLTTISQPVVAQGEVAAGLLLDALEVVGPPRHVQLPTALVVRGTTGPAAVRAVREDAVAEA